MIEIEKQCRILARQKEVIIRRKNNRITVYYKMVITKESRLFDTWEEVLNWLEKYQ